MLWRLKLFNNTKSMRGACRRPANPVCMIREIRSLEDVGRGLLRAPHLACAETDAQLQCFGSVDLAARSSTVSCS